MILLATVFLASMAVNVGRMGMSLSMKGQQLSAGDISTATAIGGLVTVLVTLLIGTLSDTLGCKRFLVLSYLVVMSSILVLIRAGELWQFCVVSSLILSSRVVIASMSPVYAADLLPRKSLGKALPLVSTMNSVSGVAGSAAAGYVLDTFGAVSLYGFVALLTLIAVIMLA
jgi:MFS family permease